MTAVLFTVAVVVVVEVLVMAAAVISMGVTVEVSVIGVWANMVIDMLAGADIIVMAVFSIALGFVLPVSHFVDVLSGMVVDALTGVIMVFETGVGVNINVFVSITTALGFAAPTPWKELSRCAEFSCRADFCSTHASTARFSSTPDCGENTRVGEQISTGEFENIVTERKTQ